MHSRSIEQTRAIVRKKFSLVSGSGRDQKQQQPPPPLQFVGHQGGRRAIGLSTYAFKQQLPKQHDSFGEHGQLEKLLHRLEQQDIRADVTTYSRLLQTCGRLNALSLGKRVHAHIIRSGLEPDIFLANHLVGMYCKCGSLEDACNTFNKMQRWNVISCTALIAAYAKHGHREKALQLFRQMQMEGVKPNRITFVTVLNACTSQASLAEGRMIHDYIIACGFEADVAVGSALVNMYGKCGSLEDARGIFDSMRERDVVSWTCLLAAYANLGHGEDALRLFQRMLLEGVKPDKITFIAVLKACASPEALTEGKMIHDLILERGFESDIFVGSALVTMYRKCGSLEDARRIFDKIHERNVVSWNAMIAAYAEHGHEKEALHLFRQMQLKGMKPDKVTFISLLSACTTLAEGKIIHGCIVDSGFESNVAVGTALVKMYSKCGRVEDAWRMFDKMHHRDIVSWNAMITTYAKHGHDEEAIELFRQMQLEDVKPNRATFINVLSSCASLADLQEGRRLHSCAFESGFGSEVVVQNALVHMYGKCGSVEDAWGIFDKMHQRTVVSWTSMIAAYVQNGHGKEALQLFRKMQQEGIKPDKITFISILSACVNSAALSEGKTIHAQVVDSGFESDDVIGTALVTMYGKCGTLKDAWRVFNAIQERGVGSWTALLAAYVQHDHGNEALQLFQRMQQERVKPNTITFIIALDACANLAALGEGKRIHALIVDGGLESEVVLGNALVNMYGKCGGVEDARRVFDKMHQRDVISWTTMIAAYAQLGHGMEALQLFQQMQKAGVKPNSITFVNILCACSHAGLVDEGCRYFVSMTGDHGITPSVSHYGCMVDLFGRAGQLEEAEDIINKMPFQPDVVAWTTLLGACRNHGSVDQGQRAAEHVLELDPRCASAYVVLSNIYAAAGRWVDAAKMRKLMEDTCVKKQPGCSSIEIENKVHEFIMGDKSHPQTEEIYSELERLSRQIKMAGYVPETKSAMHDVEDEEKERMLWCHSEKLAIAFGLINTPCRTPIRIVKNLRVCSDCHSATKFISKVTGREIFARDAYRFHFFKDGSCSCGDYW